MSDGLLWIRAGQVERANARVAEWLGAAAPCELGARPLTTLLGDCGQGLPTLAGGAREGRVECELLGEGAPKRVLVTPVPQADAPGTGVLVLQNLTEHRALEAELHRGARSLRAAERELTSLRGRALREKEERQELLTVLSHELRTPVTVIAGFNKLLLGEDVGALNDDQRHFVEESARSCQRLNAFLANLIEASRRPAPGMALDLCRTSLESTITSVLTFLKPVTDERRLHIRTALAPDAQHAWCEPMRVEQVLINLIGNAAKYAAAGGEVEVSTRMLDEDSFVEVAVQDDGPGIAPGDRERIFEPYVRVGEASKAGGLGLGLAICREIIDAHGGRILVTQPPEGGSRFSFTLPAGPLPSGGS